MEFISFNGTVFNIVPCKNSALFNKLTEMNLVKPKVPQYYLEQRDIYIDNPDNPTYREALRIYEYEKSLKSMDAAMLLCVEFQDDIILRESQKSQYKHNFVRRQDIWLNYIYANLNDNDISTILNLCFLTENTIYDIFNVLVMSIYRSGQEILNARLKNAINTSIELENINIVGIQLVHPLDEYNACIDSNMSWIEWQQLSNSDKADVVALYRIKRIVDNHSQDEMQIEMERKSKN